MEDADNADRTMQSDDGGGVGEALASWDIVSNLVFDEWKLVRRQRDSDSEEYEAEEPATAVDVHLPGPGEQLTLFDPDDYLQ